MGLIERFTRDSVSKFVWAGLLLLAVLGLAFAWTNGERAVDDERDASQARAVAYVAAVLEPRIDGSDVAAPITGQPAASLRSAVERSILVDDRVARVRVWSTDGLLLFSSDTADRPGSDAGLTDPIVSEAARDGVLTRTDVSDTGGQDDPERSLVRSYVPLDVAAVAEIDQTDEGTLGQVRTEWMWYRILAGAFVVLLLVMTMLSLRDPIERINVGVPFATSSVPAGFSLIDDDRLHAVEDVYRLAQERVARLEARLAESEEIRRGLEGDIQRSLSKAVSSAEQPAASAPAAPQAPAPAASPPVVRVPESEVVPAPLGETWAAAAPAGPLARATRDQKTPPSTARQKQRKEGQPKQKREARPKQEAPAKPKRRLRKAKEEPAPSRAKASAASRVLSVPEPAEKVAPAPKPARRAAAVAAAATAAPTPAGRTREADLDDARAHEAALETFIRLTESDRQPHDTSDVDQGAIRAALARTAARKKPGGERLQPHEGSSEESPDGPPRS
jgi:hypothetical protein